MGPRELQTRRKLQIVFTSPEVLDQEVRSPDSLLLETAADIGAQRIFIDGVGLLNPSPPGSLLHPQARNATYRELLQQIIEALSREKLTALISHETGISADRQLTLEAAGFLADTVINLSRKSRGGRVHRTLEVVKSRGQDYDAGEHTLKIASGAGLGSISPRAGASAPQYRATNVDREAFRDRRGRAGRSDRRRDFRWLHHHGRRRVGSGKNRPGHATAAGRRNAAAATGLLVSLDEHPAQILRNSATLGLDLQAQVEAGEIHILFESPQELEIDVHFADIVRLIEKHDIKRLVVDGMSSYSTALGDLGALPGFLSRAGGILQVPADVDFFQLRKSGISRHLDIYAGLSRQLDRGQYHSVEPGGTQQFAPALHHRGQGARQRSSVRQPRIRHRRRGHPSSAC